MRITNSMVTATVLKNINRNLGKMAKLQEQMSSQEKVSKPSDDPKNISRIMRLRSTVQKQEKFEDTMKDAQTFVDNAEGALATVSDILTRARELAVDASNGDMTASDRETVLAEVDELIGEAKDVGNSNFNGRYIFAGLKTETEPFQMVSGTYVEGVTDADTGTVTQSDSIKYVGNSGKMEWEIAEGVTMSVNIPGDELFQDSDSGVFSALIGLKDALWKSDQDALNGSVLKGLDAASNHVVSERAVLGAKSNRLDIAQKRASQSNLNTTKLLASIEDVDLAEISVSISAAEAVYNASLETGVMVIQPTLLDYLG